jgi:hypothetical protein
MVSLRDGWSRVDDLVACWLGAGVIVHVMVMARSMRSRVS